MNTARIKIEGVGDSVILAGTAATALNPQRAGVLTTRPAGRGAEVVNSIALRGRYQPMLKVTVAEVAPTIIKVPGINLSAKLNHGTAAVSFTNSNPFTVPGGSLVGNNAAATAFCARPPVSPAPGVMESADSVRTRSEAFKRVFFRNTMTTSYRGVERAEPSDVGK